MAKHSRAIYFFAVLIVVVSNVVFAPDWQSGPLSPMPKFKVSTYETPATPANTDGPNAALSKTVQGLFRCNDQEVFERPNSDEFIIYGPDTLHLDLSGEWWPPNWSKRIKGNSPQR
jgi:hypothetical protein